MFAPANFASSDHMRDLYTTLATDSPEECNENTDTQTSTPDINDNHSMLEGGPGIDTDNTSVSDPSPCEERPVTPPPGIPNADIEHYLYLPPIARLSANFRNENPTRKYDYTRPVPAFPAETNIPPLPPLPAIPGLGFEVGKMGFKPTVIPPRPVWESEHRLNGMPLVLADVEMLEMEAAMMEASFDIKVLRWADEEGEESSPDFGVGFEQEEEEEASENAQRPLLEAIDSVLARYGRLCVTPSEDPRRKLMQHNGQGVQSQAPRSDTEPSSRLHSDAPLAAYTPTLLHPMPHRNTMPAPWNDRLTARKLEVQRLNKMARLRQITQVDRLSIMVTPPTPVTECDNVRTEADEPEEEEFRFGKRAVKATLRLPKRERSFWDAKASLWVPGEDFLEL
ncbi:hypothetical protein BDZ91DRAFT_827030 [Kalaharituber pfeilii]|nr:hypothetical protein BDZ91DRAFT_827030 [Kalaharituber pfeilii]